MSKVPDGVSVIIPVERLGDPERVIVQRWLAYTATLGRTFEIIVVDDRPESEGETVELSGVKVIRNLGPHGFGASIRKALEVAAQPLIFQVGTNYPYEPSDLGKLLTRIGETDELLNRPIDIVSGCRHGRPIPKFADRFGRIYRTFCRVMLGLPLERPPSWFGFGEVVRSWFYWLVMGVPLFDPFSAYKLYRRKLFDKFPIQSDDDFVHVELVAKATFTTCLIDEIPLTPSPEPIPRPRRADFSKVFADPQFRNPHLARS